MNQQQQIAKTIIEQIKAGTTSNLGRTISGSMALMCWGASAFHPLAETESYRGGLTIQVNGAKHVGPVTVELAWDDTYTVVVGETRTPQIFFDQLTEVIDGLVEA
jgi:hypothetical protein